MEAESIERLWSWFRKHFLRVLALAIVVYLIFDPWRGSHMAYLLLAVAFWGLDHDRVPVTWRKFLPWGIPLLLFPLILWQWFPPIWNDVVYWQLGAKPHLVNLDPWFKTMAWNNGWMFRVIKTPWLTAYFRWIYANGFTLPVLVPVFRSFLAKDSRKMVSYILSAHVLQFFMIFPFYLTFHANEVWYVLGAPDGMARHLSAAQAAVDVLNCFPSMHTSVAFAMLLIAWREKDRFFRWVWAVFGLSVIYSTLYLEIHWVIDVMGGLLLAVAAVKLGDWVIAKASAKWGWWQTASWSQAPLPVEKREAV
ncbi:Inositolphosphotransferase Aur1/Ipt1 [Acididesulfobacillus acetoxydans]|uniref:Inositolphosphotransferase Aur1/Ipt1 n=1 Tax=Acididesulfobacillus acetoxydans TaxID=1561005 RepID=A0A8S0X6G7_9FIRM|nr:phosphatase PAP2 family protein [Acididesulfobacillus acetoxydans]CAA7602510.1 Inositolphosphotransferase Aur1/Ipt1 [Acididesulfobacillus acetoxydans]CEJ05965.1 PAP2 super protein [Acididesulfobacillus acetoxydans]